ncbi:hypothetical protein A7U60_g2419 [Sanghuangporus baumii]|uniref:DUF6534 domain-containing protein n=1 Tax=Sanghuangporus baumii TaxID=108892 RepID=A0A9Q5NAN5_SANBA|nr:hypothetical protein A7U60_g2419 [Sanghuangporus baumii]
MSSIPSGQLDSTLGCLFLGVVFTSVLWGAGCIQLYFYYERYWKTDRLWLKVYMCLVWMLDTAHQALLVESIYVPVVRGLSNPLLYLQLPKTATNMGILTAIIAAMVQILFVRRAWYLSDKNRILLGILCADVLAQFVVTTIYYGQIYHLTLWTQFTEVVHTELIMNCISAITDTFLGVVLVWLLWKNRSGVKRTDSLVTRLVLYTVGSGLVTAIWTFVALIGARVAPNSLIYLLADLIFPKLYVNCILASLNARSSLRGTLGNDVGATSIRFEERSSSSAERSIIADIENSGEERKFGCLFLSVIFSTALWGVGCLQLYYYYDKFWATDPRWLKVYIFLLWMVDTAQQALRLEINYVFFVKGIADPTLLNHLPRTFAWSGILVAIVDAMVQVLFVRRAWHLSNKSCILSAVLFIFVLGQFAATMIYSARLYSFSQLSQVKEAIHVELAMNCIMAFTDTMLALVLIYLLWKGRSGIKRTNSVVNRLITYTVGSGLVMALCMIAALIAAQAAPNSFIYLVIDESLPKLYFNCLLASLNSRESLRGLLQNGIDGRSLCLEDRSVLSRRAPDQSASFSKTSSPRAIECRVDIGVESGVDLQKASNFSVLADSSSFSAASPGKD